MMEQEKLKVLMVQAQLRWKDPQANREHLADLLAGSSANFDLAVFPETFTTGFLGDSDLPEEDMQGPTVSWMQQLAQEHQAAICGSAVIVEQGQRFNRFIMLTPEGEVRQYDKRHLFAFGGEHTRYVAGTERLTWPWRGWRINPQVCYDLRFPAWCRNINDYDLQIYVANWPEKRVEHWMALLRARAIENQAYVVGINRVGRDGKGMVYPGRSLAFDPLGQLLLDQQDSERTDIVEMNLTTVAETREQFPFLADADEFILKTR